MQLASIDMNSNSNEEDGDEAKEDDGVDKNRNSTGLEVAKLHNPVPPWKLKEQTWTQQQKQNYSYHYRTPVCHPSFSSVFFLL